MGHEEALELEVGGLTKVVLVDWISVSLQKPSPCPLHCVPSQWLKSEG